MGRSMQMGLASAGHEARTGRASGDRGNSTGIDRHAEDQRLGGHAVPSREDRERRGRDGAPKVTGPTPEGAENAGGDTGDGGVNYFVGTADHEPEQDPEVDATFAGAGQPAGGGANGARVTVTDEVMRPERGRKPLEREPWTRQRDETSAQGTGRSKPSRACETLRAERRRAWDARR